MRIKLSDAQTTRLAALQDSRDRIDLVMETYVGAIVDGKVSGGKYEVADFRNGTLTVKRA